MSKRGKMTAQSPACPFGVDPARWKRLTDKQRFELFFLPADERKAQIERLTPKPARPAPKPLFRYNVEVSKVGRRMIAEGKEKQAKFKQWRDTPNEQKRKKQRKRKLLKSKAAAIERVRAETLKAMRYTDFLQSPYWKAVRAKVLKRDGYQCQHCNSSPGKVGLLHVHHKSYKHHGREHRFLGDLVTLCKNCHEAEHGIS